jgi:KDO2-lipid IV(A) lauroyltransferase
MARQKSGPRAEFEYALVAGLAGLLRALPLERAVRLGAFLGGRIAAIDRFNRPVAMRNLEIAFPESSPARRLAVLRGSYRNWGRMAAEWTHLHEINRGNIERYVAYDGFENMLEAERSSHGRGTLVVTAHFGNFELMAAAHAIYGHRVAVVHRPLRNPRIDVLVSGTRAHFGNLNVDRRFAARTVLRLLRDNWMVVVPLDLDVRRGLFVDFFSIKACTSTGLARLAMASGAPVLPAFMVREGSTLRHRITILPQLEAERCAGRQESIHEITQHATAAIETMVRRHPDHWHWIHRRWKTRPLGEKRFY